MGKQMSPNPNPLGSTITLADGDYNSLKDSYLNSGNIFLNEYFNNNAIFNNSFMLSINGGILRNYGGLVNNGTLANNNGTLGSNQSLVNTGRLTNNKGTLNNNDGDMLSNNNEGALDNINDGRLNNDGTLNNKGWLYNKGNPLNYSTLNNYIMLINNGVIDNSENKLGAKGFINNGTNGTYQVTGNIKGSCTDHETVKPGNCAGGMLVDGNYYKKGGSKEIELGGTYHGDGDRTATEHDWIEITGDLELAGKPDVSLIDGFKLSAGDSFVIAKVDGDLSGEYDGLDEGDSVGRFENVNGGKLDLFIT
ncbi:hypothetical protein PMIT1342_00774 [Prochlorococcus marinus str. MIT 1342]|uniref:hypothetical protein n=1 Tax=Prochlorococcus TaxID=1218 RepID=UPI0007BC3394|nr:hypothetical protein [Prochlorococcus marinus]KZR82308.1 hypothetical protein PMIT1342_00774 [Prochlorococcus marinus str. MIT 1342]